MPLLWLRITISTLTIPAATTVYAIRKKTGQLLTGYSPDQPAVQAYFDATPSMTTAYCEIIERPNA